MHIRSFCISGVPGITVSVFQMGGAGIKRVVIILLGCLFFQRVQTCFASFLRVQTGVRVLLCRLESCFYAGGHWGLFFVTGFCMSSSERAFARSALRSRFGCLFHCSGICSVLFSQTRPVVQGCFCVWCAFARLCCFTGGSWLLEGSKTGRSSFHNLGHLGLCTFIGRLADGGVRFGC